MFGKLCFVVIAIIFVTRSEAVPKNYEAPASMIGNAYPNNEWRRSYNNEVEGNKNDTVPAGTAQSADRTERLGSFGTGFGSGVQGYPQSGAGGVGVYSPLKIDLGGVVLGALVGIGALLILPKLVSAFSGSHNYYRTADGADATGVTEMLAKFDDFLGQNNIDSAACMQRAVCNYIRSSKFHTHVGTADQMETLVNTLSENSLVDYIIDGTAIKEAVENGKNMNERECDQLYPACPVDRKSAMNLLTQFLPNRNQNKVAPSAAARP